MIIRICLTLLICLWSVPSLAEPLYGLAMHGAPKYGPEATHLEYANPDAPKGGTLKQAMIGTFDSVNPYAIKGNAVQGLNLVYDRLMARVWDEPFTLYPLIAERVEVPEDRSGMTVHINPKARFHDGSAVTADDVIFSFETLRDEGRPNMRQIYRLGRKVEKLDERTVKFSFGEGYDQETVMIFAMMPVLSKTWWEGREFDSTLLESPNLNGPYRIGKIDPGKRIIYERVEDYWAQDLLPNAGHYNFDRVIYDYYRDDTVALQAFTKGDLNLRREYDVAKWVTAYEELPDEMTQNIIPHQRPERARAFIFNMRRAPFDDIRVRQAMLLAFDYDWVGENIFYSKFRPVNSYFVNSHLSGAGKILPEALALLKPWEKKLQPAALAPELKIIPKVGLRQRLRAASSLLDEAGWAVVDGMRVKDGQPLRFEILINMPEDEKIALNFQKSLKRLGITMNVRLMDSAAFQDRLRAYDYDMVSYFWQNSLSPGTEQMLYWSCAAAAQEARWNFAGICLEPLDTLAGAIATTESYADLVTHAQAIDRILLSETMAIPLFYSGSDYIAHHKDLKKSETVPLYGTVLETWWMDRTQP